MRMSEKKCVKPEARRGRAGAAEDGLPSASDFGEAAITREALLGVAVGLVVAMGVILLGIASEFSPLETLWRAAGGATVGFAMGWLIFGKFGAAIVREAAGRSPKGI